MKNILRASILSILMLSISVLAFSQAPQQAVTNLTKEEQGIEDFLNRYDDAVVDRDIKKLETYLADDFMMITPIGSVMTREQILAPFQPNVENRSALESIETINYQVNVYDGSAVATAITSHKFKESSNRAVSRYRNTYSLVEKGGQWQIAAIHVFRFSN